MADTIEIVQGTATTIEIAGLQGPQGPQGATGSGLGTLTTQGDTLYQGASAAQRLPIGTAGQILKVNAGGTAPEWGAAPASGVSSVNTLSGDVVLEAADVDAAPDIMPAVYVLASTDPAYAPISGYYYRSDTAVGGKAAYYKIGTRENTSITYSSASTEWQIKHNATIVWVSNDNPVPNDPWDVADWEPIGSDPSLTVSQADTVLFTNAVAQKASSVSTKSDIGLSNVDNTSDANKPISTAVQTALDGKAAANHTHTGSQVNVGSTSGLPLRTGTNGVVEAGAFGTAAGSFAAGDDVRFSDARTPTAHAASHAAGGTDELFDQDLNTTDDVTFDDITCSSLISSEMTFTGEAGIGFTNEDGKGNTRTNLGAAASGSITASGLTQSTARILGRTTASTGAIEEIQIGSGLSLSAGELSATASGGSKTYAVFTPTDNQPPATSFATLDTRNSIAVLDFDAATDESAVFVGIIPEGASLGSGLKVRLHWMASSATSGNCRWAVQFEKSGTDLDSDSFDTATEAHSAANGTSGIETVTEITATAIDSLAAGDRFRLKVFRNADDATNDTMTGDAELIAVEVRSAA